MLTLLSRACRHYHFHYHRPPNISRIAAHRTRLISTSISNLYITQRKMATAAASAPLPTKEAPPSNPPTQNVGGAKKAKAKKGETVSAHPLEVRPFQVFTRVVLIER